MIDLSRVDSFYVGQVWESPRGNLYKVISSLRGGQATLRLGSSGGGRIIRRGWADVIGWVIFSDDGVNDVSNRVEP